MKRVTVMVLGIFRVENKQSEINPSMKKTYP
jgi:hypothetical protein